MPNALTRKGQPTESPREPTIGGVYEVCIGVADITTAIQYWQQCGYRVGDIGALDASVARALDGVDSDVRSVRLLHGEADHGLLRLQSWQQPTGDGPGTCTSGGSR